MTEEKKPDKKEPDEKDLDKAIKSIDDEDENEVGVVDIGDDMLIRRIVYFIMFIFAGIFAIYTTSFLSEKPIPEIEFLKFYLDKALEFLKFFFK